MREVYHFYHVMTDAEAYVKALESSRLELHVWLDEFSKRLASAGPVKEPAEAQSKLEVCEASWKEFKANSPASENLQKQAFEIGDGDMGTVPGRKIQITLQLNRLCNIVQVKRKFKIRFVFMKISRSRIEFTCRPRRY